MADHNELIQRAADDLAEIDIAAARARAAVASAIRRETGIEITFGKPAIMDATGRDLLRMRFQVDHYAAAHKLITQHVSPTDPRPLGEVMRQLPEEVRELIADHLIRAGLS